MSALLLLLLAAEAPPLASAGKTVHTLTVTQTDQSGGTMHLAGKTVIKHLRKAAVVPEPAPLIEHQLELAPNAWLVLGWSSGGGGRQTDELLTLRDDEALAVTDRLAWDVPRANGCVLIAHDALGWRVGFPEQASARLTRAGKPVALEPGPLALEKDVWAYCPPFGEAMKLEGRVAWLRATADGFRTDTAGPR